LTWRDFVKQAIHKVITQPEPDPLACTENHVSRNISETEQVGVKALVIEELRRLDEGVLARYDLRASQFKEGRHIMVRYAGVKESVL